MQTVKMVLAVLMLVFTARAYGASSSVQPAPGAVAVREDTVVRLQKLAEQGDAKAQSILASMYATGAGVPKNAAKAAEWYQKSASQGDARAQTILGTMYAGGDGVLKDPAKGREWLQRAAEQGYADAQFKLGMMYKAGNGVAKNPSQAIDWLQKAADQGHAGAQCKLGTMYRTGDGVRKNAGRATKWFQQAAAAGNAEGQFNLGVMYATGTGVPKIAARAAEWFQKAAQQGEVQAQNNLGIMYATGDGVPKDSARAMQWLRRAAEQGYPDAQFNLGVMYTGGAGVPKNAAVAAEWFQKAAAQGDANAQFNVGMMYRLGEGVPEDRILAYAWLNLAAAQHLGKASKGRNMLELNSVERAEAERISANWVKGHVLRREGAPAAHSNAVTTWNGMLEKSGTGMAFLISMQGLAVTSNHIVADCKEVRVPGHGESLHVIARDESDDLALLKLTGETHAAAVLTPDPAGLRQGQEIVVFSLPPDGRMSPGDERVPGAVSATIDLGDDNRQMRILAPVQLGAGGSPLLDRKGNVVGVITRKLGDPATSDAAGTPSPEVNFAAGGQALESFLDANRVPYKTGRSFFARNKSLADLGAEARRWTAVVECWK